MKKFFLYEFKRLFFSKENLFGMITIILCLIIPYILNIRDTTGEDACINFINIRANFHGASFPLLMPIIACIPSSLSYITDKKSNILNFIFLKIKIKDYLKIRLIINLFISGLLSLIPQLVMFIFLFIKHGISDSTMDIWGAFSNIFNYSKVLYIFILLLMSFISSAVFSTFALGISAIIENKYLTVLIPFVYLIISGTIFEMIGINKFFSLNAIILFEMDHSLDITTINVLIYEIILFLIGIGLFFYFGKKNNYE